MLLMGCSTGKIQCISISDSDFKAKSMVWSDMDQMPVPLNGPVGTLCPEGILFIVPKMGHLLIFWLDSDANLINFFTHSTDDIAVTGESTRIYGLNLCFVVLSFSKQVLQGSYLIIKNGYKKSYVSPLSRAPSGLKIKYKLYL